MTKMVATRILNASTGQLSKKRDTMTLENIIRQFARTKVSWGLKQNDIVFAIAFWAMIECGFQSIPQEEAIKLKDKDHGNLPKNWKHKTRHVYEAHFYLPPHSNHPVKLVALPAGDILCLNVLASGLSPRSINLKSVAVSSTGYVPRPEEDPTTLSDLADFQLLLKNLIIWPIRCSILTDMGILNGSLCGLSDEIKLKIVRHLSVAEVVMLSQTCHDLNRICSDQRLWKALFHANFQPECKCAGEGKECEEALDWKKEFKEAYYRKRAERNAGESPSGSYHTPPEGAYGSESDFGID